MQDIYFLDPVPRVELLHEAECDDDWLAPLGLSSKPGIAPPASVPDLRRTHSTPSLATVSELKPTMNWAIPGAPTSPLPIRSTRCSSGDLQANASMESAQTLLGGSCPETNGSFLFGSVSNGMQTFESNPFMSGSAPVQPFLNQQQQYPAMGSSLPTGWVPSSSAPIPMSSGFDDDMRVLDEALEMISYGNAQFGGSCPLPVLLEDSVSEDHTSDDSVHHLGSFSMDVDSTSPWLMGGQRSVRSAPRPVSMPRSVPVNSRAQRSMDMTVRNGSPVGGALAHLMSSSCPSDTNRPQRNAARRSLAVTAAALREYDDGSESDSEGQVTFAEAAIKRGNGSLGKKKHNPWSLEETGALVSGVQMAGLGKWAEIKRLPIPSITETLATRSAVDLKDKWRNLTRVARLPKAQLKARLARSASEVPFDMMLTVKSLMDSGSAMTD